MARLLCPHAGGYGFPLRGLQNTGRLQELAVVPNFFIQTVFLHSHKIDWDVKHLSSDLYFKSPDPA